MKPKQASQFRFGTLLILGASIFLALALSGCGLLNDDDDGNDNDSASNTTVRVLEAYTSNAINEQQQATGLVSRVFPAETNQVFAVLTLSGVEPGMEIVGRWYQLSVQDAPAAGAEVSAAGVTLTADNISEGNARVALNLTSGSGNLPQGDWVVRVYADGAFIRTMGFVITQLVQQQSTNQQQQPPQGGNGGNQQPTQPTQAAPTPVPAEVPVLTEYTVVSGDSLSSIALEFKADDESVEAFVTRLIQLNNLQPGSALFVGQVLKIPGEQ